VSKQLNIAARHAHYLEQYFNGVESKFVPFLRKAAQSIRGELLKTQSVKAEKTRQKKLNFIEAIINTQFKLFTDELDKDISELAQVEAEFTAGMMKRSAKLEMELPALSQMIGAIKARPFAGVTLKDYLKDFPAQQAARIKNAVSVGFLEGQTTQEIVRNVIGTKSSGYRDGELELSRTSAERMVRTSLNHTANVARESVYEENDDLIPFYEWVSTLDGRTSPVCRSRDGQIYRTGRGKLPPAHYNCRSTTAPLIENDVEIKNGKPVKKPTDATRASRDGQVDADLNYNDWLKKQSKRFQDDVLGKTRASLFRNGDLTMDKFVNDRGKQLTLAELKQKFPRAWGELND
jgi:SPP1 gp7 family putative phage head morphogenesis protein